jgi:hypothetical protein
VALWKEEITRYMIEQQFVRYRDVDMFLLCPEYGLVGAIWHHGTPTGNQLASIVEQKSLPIPGLEPGYPA